MLAIDTALGAVTTEIQVAGNAETYTAATTIGNGYDLAQDLVTWANAGARIWTGTITFAWSWSRDTATGGALFTLSASAVFDINVFIAELNIPTVAAAQHSLGSAPATGTWAPSTRIAVRGLVRTIGEGDAGGSLSVRPGSPGMGGWRPKVDAVGTALDAARLAAVLSTATTPRRGWLYQVHTATWRQLALGAVSRSAEGAKAYRFSFETAGAAL